MEQERTQPATKRVRPSPPPRALAAGVEDRLSALDDATLHAILARVPLRDAAATAVLSRRWPRVFATLPRLTLPPGTFNRRGFPDEGDDDLCEDPQRWMDGLRRVLDARAAPVAALEIDSRFMGVHCDWFNKIFRMLCGNKVLMELSVANTDYTECYTLPFPVYSCTTLTSLDLYNCRLQPAGCITGLLLLRSLRLRNVTATDADLCRMIRRCSAMEHLEIHDVHKARNINIHAPCLKKLVIYSYRPLCISMKKPPPLDMVRLSFSYGYPEHSWSLQDTDKHYTIHETEEMLDYKKMAEREHRQTNVIKNMTTFLRGLSSAKKLQLHLSTEYSEVSLFWLNEVQEDQAEVEMEEERWMLHMAEVDAHDSVLAEHFHRKESNNRGNSPASSDSKLFDSISDSNVVSMAKASMRKSLPQKSCLLGLQSLSLTLDHNHEVLATLVSCLLNSSPNLKELRIIELRHLGSPAPLAVGFWETQIKADDLLNHLSSVTFYTDSLFEGHPCGGICKFLVMNARVLKRMRIEYHYSQAQPEHAKKLEAARRELPLAKGFCRCAAGVDSRLSLPVLLRREVTEY
ncbi:hypothetical protein HU200_059733 [Digitaria exilis]|uniref:F-box/LRR-repeat protein 15/At3g58940/PEG3-like LRR domain-containing protein n=1 Tax=Digitaria exilis TaxID=1010633 RepID=A0A835ADV6_9POAL|nr:hypothetical protein HU200_059733 [Digitaria exilis]